MDEPSKIFVGNIASIKNFFFQIIVFDKNEEDFESLDP